MRGLGGGISVTEDGEVRTGSLPLRCFFSCAMRASRPETYLAMNGSSILGIPSLTSAHSSSGMW